MPVTMYEASTGKPVQVDEADVQAHFQSGKFGFDQSQRIPVQGRDGSAVTISPTELGKALRSGYSVLSEDQAQKIRDEKQYGGIGGAAIAVGEGAVRGATLGLSDPLAIEAARLAAGDKAAEQTRIHLQKYKAVNPVSSTVGEIGGAIAPILATGGAAAPEVAAVEGAANVARAAEGASALARAGEVASTVGKAASTITRTVGAPSRATALAGELAERGVAAVLGEGSTSAVAKIAKEALKRGAGDAVQGALMGAGNEISESALGDHELVADKMLASIGHGALFAGLLGAGFGATGQVAKIGLEKASPTLKRFSQLQAVRSLFAGTGLERTQLMKSLQRIPGGIEGVGEELMEGGLVRAGDTVHDIAPRVTAAADEVGAKRLNLVRQLDSKGIAAPEIDSIGKKFFKWMEAEHGGFRETEAGAFGLGDKLISDLKTFSREMSGGEMPSVQGRDELGRFLGLEDAPAGKLTFEQLWDWRRRLDKKINWAQKNPLSPESVGLETKKALRGIIEDEIKEVGEAGAKQLGSEFLREYEQVGLKYRRLITASEIANDAVARLNKNQMFGLGEKMMFAAELGGSLAAGEPLGIAKGLAAAVAGKIVRERGNATAAAFLDKVASLSAVQKTIQRADQRISTDVEKFFRGKSSSEPSLKTLSKSERDMSFENAIYSVRSAANDLHGVAEAVDDHAGPLVAHAPRIVSAFGQGAARAAMFLASKMPRVSAPITIQPHLYDEKRQIESVPTAEKEKFLRFVRAVNDPLSAISDMTRGRLSSEAVESLQVVYPKLLSQIHAQVLARAADPEAKPLTLDQHTQLSRLLGRPTHPTLQPAFMARMQESYDPVTQSAPTPKPPPNSGNLGALDKFNSKIALRGFGGKAR